MGTAQRWTGAFHNPPPKSHLRVLIQDTIQKCDNRPTREDIKSKCFESVEEAKSYLSSKPSDHKQEYIGIMYEKNSQYCGHVVEVHNFDIGWWIRPVIRTNFTLHTSFYQVPCSTEPDAGDKMPDLVEDQHVPPVPPAIQASLDFVEILNHVAWLKSNPGFRATVIRKYQQFHEEGAYSREDVDRMNMLAEQSK
jgi:hypothetical protein